MRIYSAWSESNLDDTCPAIACGRRCPIIPNTDREYTGVLVVLILCVCGIVAYGLARQACKRSRCVLKSVRWGHSSQLACWDAVRSLGVLWMCIGYLPSLGQGET